MLGQMIVLDRAVAASSAFRPTTSCQLSYRVTSAVGKAANMTTGLPPFSFSVPSITVPPSIHSEWRMPLPTTTDPVSAVLTHRAAGWEEGNGRGWDMSAGEDALESSLRQ